VTYTIIPMLSYDRHKISYGSGSALSLKNQNYEQFLGPIQLPLLTVINLKSQQRMAFIPPPPDDPLSSPGPFEGPEKLLEVWFAPSPDALPSSSTSSLKPGRSCGDGQQGEYRGLRRVPRAVWEEMLDIVKCKVLSVVEGEEVDAYLLR
jgi:hypothetical protein